MPTVETPGFGNIFFSDIGKASGGTPLLLIHGAAASHLMWPAAMRRISERRVISPDLPGHGRSDQPGYDRVSHYASAMVQMMDVLEIPQVVAVGHSMGGAIAQCLTLEAPQRVAGLVLIGTGPALHVNPTILDMVHDDLPAVAEMIVRWAWSMHSMVDEQLRDMDRQQILANPPAVVYGDYLACDRFDVQSQLHQIHVPALIIGGEMDKMTPFDLSESLAQSITGSTLVKIDRAGHMMLLEQTDVVVGHIHSWIQEHLS